MSAAITPSAPAPLLSVSGLVVDFGPLRALAGVDLQIRPGEVVALAGENGAGKTTLVRCIAGDVAPAAGEIRLAGRPVSPNPVAAAREGVSVVWQDLALCDNLDVASNLLLGRERRRHLMSDVRFHAEAAALLGSLEIPLRDTTRNVRSLSGGQRQLVAVARAVARQPRLLLLDEPTASLGVKAAAQVEELISSLREQGTTIMLACHSIEQMFRLADRIVVLRQGRVVADVPPRDVHPDDVLALLSGQQVDASARRQLTRLHGLADRLVSADPSSSLSLILSALGAALGAERVCIHLSTEQALVCTASLGLPRQLLTEWARLPYGPAGGPVGLAAAAERPFIEENVRTGHAWAPFSRLATAANVASSWSVPVMGPGGHLGVITVFRQATGEPQRDQLDLVNLYAGYAASAIERDRLLEEVTARNRVLETIREMLETLAGPIPAAEGLGLALQSLRQGLEADEVALLTQQPGQPPRCRALAGALVPNRHRGASGVSTALLERAGQVLTAGRRDGVARHLDGADGQRFLAVTFGAPGGPTALLAGWQGGSWPDREDWPGRLSARAGAGGQAADATALLEDAAHSLRLALEREEAVLAHQEAAALRRSQELQRGFLSRLSHELRTPLTAIRGYASSLLQPDVTWDGESQQRFLARIAAESARLGRLVGDLLDFSAIESGVLRLQRDWCELPLVLDAAVACLPPSGTGLVEIECDPGLPVVWADHDRLEQLFVNLLDNAIGHNPPGTRVTVSAASDGPGAVIISVTDDGAGMPPELAAAPFEPMRRWRRTRTAGAGLGLSIANGIVAAHGGRMELEQPGRGTRFRIILPTELPGRPSGDGEARSRGRGRRLGTATGELVPATRNGHALRGISSSDITMDEAGADDR
jgi:signal transduction histidine kinase/ABC-type multidrug transport system ATPase subunit